MGWHSEAPQYISRSRSTPSFIHYGVEIAIRIGRDRYTSNVILKLSTLDTEPIGAGRVFRSLGQRLLKNGFPVVVVGMQHSIPGEEDDRAPVRIDVSAIHIAC